MLKNTKSNIFRALPILLAMLLVAVAAPAPASSAESETLDVMFIRSMSAALRAQGHDPAPFLDTPTEMTVHNQDGTIDTFTITIREAVMTFAGDTPYQTQAAGAALTPTEIVTGDFLHIAFSQTFDGSSARPYTVTTSETIPETPPVLVPVSDPTETATIPWASVVDYGGPALNVKGRGYDVGLHILLSSQPTLGAGDGAAHVPFVSPAIAILDHSIDMVGHAQVSNLEVCITVINMCLGLGFIIAGVALAQFNAEDVVLATGDSLSTAFPMLP